MRCVLATRHSSLLTRKGFTLLELMVVMVLIGILSAVIIPEMKGTYQDALLRSTSRQLVSVLNLAYSRAVTLNQAHRVRLDKTSGRFFLERRAPGAQRKAEFVRVPDLPGSEGELDQRISLALRKGGLEVGEDQSQGAPSAPSLPTKADEAPDTIAFYPDGTAEGAEILLTDREGFQLALRINAVTARVHIIKPDRQTPAPQPLTTE